MKKIKKRIKLRKPVKELLVKIIITLVILVADVVLYHYLGIYGSYAVENSWASAFVFVGWFWLLAGQFGWLFLLWE
jgi:hypothetical protein